MQCLATTPLINWYMQLVRVKSNCLVVGSYKGAMGYYLYSLSCDSDDTGEENTLEQLNLEQEMLSCKTNCFLSIYWNQKLNSSFTNIC